MMDNKLGRYPVYTALDTIVPYKGGCIKRCGFYNIIIRESTGENFEILFYF